MNCIKCKDKFTYKERLKSVFQYKGKKPVNPVKTALLKRNVISLLIYSYIL